MLNISTRIRLAACYFVACFTFLFLAGCDSKSPLQVDPAGQTDSAPRLFVDDRSFHERVGTNFTDTIPEQRISEEKLCCKVEVVELQAQGMADAVWGSLGVLANGNIWVGLSGAGESSGQILEIVDGSLIARSIGSVEGQVTNNGENLNRQKKVHSRIRQAANGKIYFSSMNETGESWRDDRLPEFGSYIWSTEISNSNWVEVIKAPEAVIALDTSGRYVYALAYWGHVLYQYDTHTESVRMKRVGSECGHVSRNMLVDGRERVYVPKLRKINSAAGCKPENMVGSLVEIGTDLSFIKQHQLPNFYGKRSPAAHQGITAFAFREDQSIIFSSQGGDLYHLISYGDEDALILSLGNIDPERKMAVTNMVSVDGKSKIGAVVSVKLEGKKRELAWMVHNTKTVETKYTKLELPPPYQAYKALLLYGSGIRDKSGRVFVGGRIQNLDGRLEPIVLRLTVD